MNKKDIKILTKAGWTVEDDRITHWDCSSASGTTIDLVLKNILATEEVNPLKILLRKAIVERDRMISYYETDIDSEVEEAIVLAGIAGLDSVVAVYTDRLEAGDSDE